jgi:hypothetical protein
MNRTWVSTTERLPLLIFMGMYLFSCYLGVLGFLISNDFWAWTNFYSGPRLPSLSRCAFWALLALLHGGPILLWLGYEAGMVCCRRVLQTRQFGILKAGIQAKGGLAWGPYSFSIAVALISLVRAGAFANIASWTDYNSYVHARWALFSKLKFFEYVNLYTWLPVSATFLILLRRNWRWLFLPVLAIVSLFQLSLFPKKSLLTSMMIIGCSAWVYWHGGKSPRKAIRMGFWLRSVAAFCVFLYLIHAALSIRLVISSRSQAFALSEEERLIAQQQGRLREVADIGQGLEKSEADAQPPIVKFDRTLRPSASDHSVWMYAFLAPLTRTSVPSIAYPGRFC